MTTIQKRGWVNKFNAGEVMSLHMPLKMSAGLYTNTAPTIINSSTVNTSIRLRVPPPRYLPMSVGRLAPSCRNDSMPLMKSCTAPAKMLPSTIHR